MEPTATLPDGSSVGVYTNHRQLILRHTQGLHTTTITVMGDTVDASSLNGATGERRHASITDAFRADILEGLQHRWLRDYRLDAREAAEVRQTINLTAAHVNALARLQR